MNATIVIPVFNRAQELSVVLDGLGNQTETMADIEVLVCDDGSTEDLSATTDTYKTVLPNLRLIRQAASGPAAARNLGIRESNADTIIFLDSDIVLDEDVVAQLIHSLKVNPDWVGAEGRVVGSGGNQGPLWYAPTCRNGGVYLTANIAYRKDVLLSIGGFDEGFPRAAAEDVDLAIRVMEKGSIGFNPEAVVTHPRSRKTFRTHWNKRLDWESVRIIADRHRVAAWPGRSTRYPRLRTAFCALIKLPAGRALASLRFAVREKFVDGMIGSCHALFDIICSVTVMPSILFGKTPDVRDYLTMQPAGPEMLAETPQPA